ncbi:uncharacterized protein PHACADRAFT_255694 [Phanerochaete carnosa HHB-10118-sp]|uniref:Uncharacterized protein n=1 Tax=Phanerochaete carnosa (strain HHB-10118-sp) TaxID=650164 RepID=K5W7T1_PHACS|nr:uncharacterized protein PHACADRAFT_255694 [Phanerochaete carnosa HHB-10118-sp]EKM55230.1 hypothetical protein PHACADRAFT_255694 [Phanerochaete carnosa HHB-10118-sp]
MLCNENGEADRRSLPRRLVLHQDVTFELSVRIRLLAKQQAVPELIASYKFPKGLWVVPLSIWFCCVALCSFGTEVTGEHHALIDQEDEYTSYP